MNVARLINRLAKSLTFDNNGLIRYNQEYKTYEGYREGQWASIVGVIDFDNDTKITADTLDHDDEDKLRFYTAATHRAIIDNSGNFGIKTEHPQVIFDINDTGATFNWIVEDWQSSCFPDDTHWRNIWCENVRFAVITDNLASDFKFKVHYSCHEVNKAEKDVWLVYPWENVATYE